MNKIKKAWDENRRVCLKVDEDEDDDCDLYD